MGVARDRRQDPRCVWSMPVKLCWEGGSRYYSGWTHDVSAGGVRLGVGQFPALTAGQKVRLGLAWGERQALLAHEELVPATIIRTIKGEGHQDIAVQFHERQVKRRQLDRSHMADIA